MSKLKRINELINTYIYYFHICIWFSLISIRITHREREREIDVYIHIGLFWQVSAKAI